MEWWVPWQRTGSGDSVKFLNSRTGKQQQDRPEELQTVLEAMQAWDMTRYPDNMTAVRDRPPRTELQQQATGSAHNKKRSAELQEPGAKVTQAAPTKQDTYPTESNSSTDILNHQQPEPWLPMHKQNKRRGLLTLSWNRDETDFLDVQPQVSPNRPVAPCSYCEINAPRQTVSFEIDSGERLSSLRFVWLHH